MSRHPAGLVIAIDGPAGSGKSTTAKAVANQLGYKHLDSGAFYRAITLAALEQEIAPERWATLRRHELDAFAVTGRPAGNGFRLYIGEEDVHERIRSPEVNAHVSIMAAVPEVRDWLLAALREAGREGGLVADGRDIGTVVFPDAELKIFLVAQPHERAARRLREQGVLSPSNEEVQEEARRLVERDRLDESREAAPLVKADDAILLDTTELTFEAQVDAITHLAKVRLNA